MKHNCIYCTKDCIKKGIRNKIQKYFCKNCRKYQQCKYVYKSYDFKMDNVIINLTKEGSGISSIARLVGVSKSIIQRRLFEMGSKINKPIFNEYDQKYELDEMTVKVAGEQDVYLIYAINRNTRKVIDFFVGNRTKENIKKVVDSVLRYHPKTIFTDGLNSYPSLIPKRIHKPGRRLTNRIERKNLTLRNFIKRLSKCTLCVSKKREMLSTVVKIYCWQLYPIQCDGYLKRES